MSEEEINTRGTKANLETNIQETEEEKVSIRKHNDCCLIVSTEVLYSDVENFEGGKLNYYYKQWKKYTSDTSYT